MTCPLSSPDQIGLLRGKPLPVCAALTQPGSVSPQQLFSPPGSCLVLPWCSRKPLAPRDRKSSLTDFNRRWSELPPLAELSEADL